MADYLIYHETLRLCVEPNDRRVWLELRNYEQVFAPQLDGVSSGTKIEPTAVRPNQIQLGAYAAQDTQAAPGEPIRANVALLFNAPDILRITFIALREAGYFVGRTQADAGFVLPPSPNADSGLTLFKAALKEIGVSDAARAALNADDPFFADPFARVAEVLKDEKRSHLSPHDYDQFRKMGFEAFFPRPDLIREEQRTRLINPGGGNGKTRNTDNRKLDLIPTVNRLPASGDAVSAYLQRVDAKWEAEVEAALQDGGISSDRAKDVAGRIEQGMDPRQARLRVLHAGLRRVDCFGFRGDDRSPDAIRGALGFLPSVTRSDPGMNNKALFGPVDDDLRERAKADLRTGEGGNAQAIGRILSRSASPGQAATEARSKGKLKSFFRWKKKVPRDRLKNYDEVLSAMRAFNLDLYIKNESLRCFTSATKSVAIAKHFSNTWKDEVECETWCYVLRCRGGFELPTSVEQMKEDDPTMPVVGDLAEEHFIHKFLEQEIAVAGGVWWENCVGFRKLVCNVNGQFFYGPVFLHKRLRDEEFTTGDGKRLTDRQAFSELFMLLSGKGQGEDVTVATSYRVQTDEEVRTWVFAPNTAAGPDPKAKPDGGEVGDAD